MRKGRTISRRKATKDLAPLAVDLAPALSAAPGFGVSFLALAYYYNIRHHLPRKF